MVSNININHSNRLDKCELATAETILLLDPFIAAPLCLAVYLHSSYICTTAPDAKYGYLCQMSVYMCANIIWHDTLACILTFSLLFSVEDYYSSSILIAIFHLYKYNTHSHIERIYEDTMSSWQLSPLGIGTLVCQTFTKWEAWLANILKSDNEDLHEHFQQGEGARARDAFSECCKLLTPLSRRY